MSFYIYFLALALVLKHTAHGIQRSDGKAVKMTKLVPALQLDNAKPKPILESKCKGSGCQCISLNCGCCVEIHIKEIKVDETACANISYLPQEIGIRVSLTVGNFVVFNETISARNPPPICLPVPYLHKQASLCLYFYNLDISDKNFSGCSKLEIKVLHFVHKTFELGCFDIPYLPEDQVPFALILPGED